MNRIIYVLLMAAVTASTHAAEYLVEGANLLDIPTKVIAKGGRAPLGEALKKLVPFSDWHVYAQKDIDQKQVVTWTGGIDWGWAVKEVSKQANAEVRADTVGKRIFLVKNATESNQRAEQGTDQDPSLAAVAAESAPAPKSDADEWVVDKTAGGLRYVLATWAHKSNLQLVWDAKQDYQVKASARYKGPIEEAVGRLLSDETVGRPPIKAQFYSGNSVLRIVSTGEE